MDSNPSCPTAVVLDQQALADQIQAIEHFVFRRLERIVDLAERLIHRHYVVDPAFGADDAVQDALLKLLTATKDGKVYSIESEEELRKLLWHMLNQEVLDERERENAGKRGGSDACHDGRAPAVRHLAAAFDVIDAHAAPPDAEFIASEAAERMLVLLDRHDAHLRVVATQKAEGLTRLEIAAQLEESLSTVKRQVRRIRTILGPHNPDLV